MICVVVLYSEELHTLGLIYCSPLLKLLRTRTKGLYFHSALGLAYFTADAEKDRNKGSQSSLQVGAPGPQGATTFNVFKQMSSLDTLARYKMLEFEQSIFNTLSS